MSNTHTHAVPSRNRAMRATAALLLGTILVGCTAPGTGPGVSRYEPTYLRLTEERAFAAALRRHYLELATNAYDRGDLDRSDFYSLRALMAAEGKLAHPGQPARHVDVGGEAAAAGQRLSMLMMTGVRMGAPDLAARAQAAYDCWLVESGPTGNPQIAQSCRYNALNSLAQLEGASTGAQLVTAGGPTVPQGQTYVIESGSPSQTINAPAGFTIEVTTTHGGGYVPEHFVQERVPATYSTIPQAAPSYVESAPVQYVETAPVQYVETTPVAAAPAYVETAPMMEQSTVSVGALPEYYSDHSGFDTTPVISAAHAEMYAAEMAPVMMEEVAMQDIGAPMNIIPDAMQMTMIEAPAVDLGPVESVPVFDTAPVETMPMVEMAPMAMSYGGDAASALMDATSNMQGDFAVFFGFDSDKVTIEAEDALIDAVEHIRLSGATRVALMGFTDSVGDARYNQLLAMRRAQAVRQYLQKSLGNSVSFEILPVGEVQAVKNGGDGVKEALNRKVELSIQ